MAEPQHNWFIHQLAKAVSGGNLFLKAYPQAAGSSAAALNLAAVGEFEVVVHLRIEDAAGDIHPWFAHAGGFVTLTPTEGCNDAQIGVPAVDDATPKFEYGEAKVILTYGTDAGVTKTYQVNDTLGFTVAVANKILGFDVDITDAGFTDTVIA